MSRREEGGCSREIPRSKAEISGSNHFLNTQMNGLYLLLLQYHIYASIALLLRLRGSREGGLAQIFFAAQCMIMEKMMPLLMWMGSRRHELTPPFLLASVPTIFSCSLFRNISLKADMPRGMGRTHQFQRSTPWKNAMDFPTNDNLLLVFSAGRAFFGLSIFRGHHALIFWFSKYMLIKTVTEKANPLTVRGGQEKGREPGMEK